MKKIGAILLVLALLGVANLAQAQEVTSVNVVGFYKITVPPRAGLVMGGLQFDAIDEADQNLLGIFGTNSLIAGSFPNEADRVYLWDTGTQRWKQYFLMNDEGDGEPWKFYSVTDLVNPTNPPLVSGQGFFIQSPGTVTQPHEVTIAGEVIGVQTQSIQVVNSFQSIAYPFSAGTTLKSLSVTTMQPPRGGDFPNQSDRVYLFNSATQKYVQYWLGQGEDLVNPGNWFLTNDADGENPQDPPIALGQGFFYQAIGGFEWVEESPYYDNLRN